MRCFDVLDLVTDRTLRWAGRQAGSDVGHELLRTDMVTSDEAR